MKPKLLFTLIFGFYIAQFLTAQNEIIISGEVIDKSNGELLSYAHVIYPKKSLGTTTNDSGQFKMVLYDALLSDSITITYIGYKPVHLEISSCLKQKIFQLERSNNLIEEVVVKPGDFNITRFMREVVEQYNKDRNENAHIAISHFREKAKKDDKYIMYTESIGYSIYHGNKSLISDYSNYSFYCDYSNAMITNPRWLEYYEFANEENPIPVGASNNLFFFRYTEKEGVLSLELFRKHQFKLIEVLEENNQRVYRISFKGGSNNGIISIEKQNRQIINIELNTNKYYSWAFDKEIKASININFQYFNDTPYVSTINAYFNKQGLDYYNDINVITQKFDKFKLSEDERFALEAYSVCQIIDYQPDMFEKYDIQKDSDYAQIEKDLSSKTVTLTQQFANASGILTCGETYDLAKNKISSLKENF